MTEVNPLAAALRRRFRSRDEALVTLGIDPYILDQKENQQMIDFDNLPRDVRDARFSMRTKTGRRIYMATDQAGGEEQDKLSKWLAYFEQRMDPADFAELKQLLAPYMHDDVPGEDEPPPFSGRPRPGGEIDPAAGTDRRDRRGRDQLFGPRGEGVTESSGEEQPYAGTEDRRYRGMNADERRAAEARYARAAEDRWRARGVDRWRSEDARSRRAMDQLALDHRGSIPSAAECFNIKVR